MNEYKAMQKGLAQGWNTWNTRSVLSHVLLPEGFALNLSVREYLRRQNLREALIGRQNPEQEQIHPGPHAYDGSYSELNMKWQGNEILVQSAKEGDDLVLLVTPLAQHPAARRSPLLAVEAGVLWNRPGYVTLEDDALVGHFAERTVRVFTTHEQTFEPHLGAQTPYFSMQLDCPVGISTGSPRTLDEIQLIVAKQQSALLDHFTAYGELSEVYKAIQTAMAWDTIYEPEHERVVSPVSRIWNVHWGGYVLFEWDNYFAAYLASAENKEIAYANAVEMTREITENGLVPNFATVNGIASRDRSEPPVGALMCRELYRKFKERWFLEEVFPDLLRWNRWWHERRSFDGLLCWGSDPYEPVTGSDLETKQVNDTEGAALESGLDNLPVYDDVPFDNENHLMMLHDAGLNGLYVADCEAMADIASVLGREEERRELKQRAEDYRQALARLWDAESGFYLNRRTDTGAFSTRIAPTSFYPLLAKAPTQEQAERMMRDHFYNPVEFWGDWIIPTISRNDPAYPDQNYWRGRIWGPMNFLVYLGLRNYNLPQARKDMAEKSKNLLLREWLEKGHVHENYDGDTGEGCNKHNSDAFYHWGGLLGMIALIEAGYMPAPEEPLV
jgi:putative isomerase